MGGSAVTAAVTTSPSPSGPPSVGPTDATASSPATASPVSAVAVLQVDCDGSTVVIPTPRVKAAADGVHVHVTNASTGTIDYGIDDLFGGGFGDSLPPEGGTFAYAFGPGEYRLSCGAATATFAVVDPDGFYTPATCSDPGSGTIGSWDYAEGATGARGSLIDVAGKQLRGLKPGDVLEHAGYPEAAGAQLVRVVRDGEVLAVLTFTDDGHGGWLISTMRSCSGSDLTIASRDDSRSPAPSAASSGAFGLQRAPTNLGCDSLPSTYPFAILRMDPTRPEAVWAEAAGGRHLEVFWSAGFRATDVTEPAVVGPKGDVVARDGERIEIPGGAWPSLHGYFLCAGADAIYVLEYAPG
jgi:hypothetical protein